MSGTRIKQIAHALLAAALAAIALAACGGSGDSSQQAQTLLRESFKGRQVNSGILAVSLVVTPSGSKTLNGPIELAFGGPFEAQGAGKAPKSHFTLRLSAFGRSGSLGVISTGTKGYVTLQGTAYHLPQSTFRQFESSMGRVTNSGRSGLRFSKIDFVSWVRHPVVVGNGTVAGASTKHIHAGIDVRKMLADLNTVIHKAPSLGASGMASEMSSASISRIAREVRNPTLDVWTGSSDHIVRKLAVNFGVPVSGSASTTLGGLRAAHVAFVLQYADVNQPQKIAAPSTAKPFGQFVTKMRAFLQGLQGMLTGASPFSGGGSSGGAASSQNLERYTQCIQSAGSDPSKMKRCAAILNGQ